MKYRCLPSRFHGKRDSMIERVGHVRTIRQRLRAFPVVAILGPRQIGKTTLARQVTEAHQGPAALRRT